MKKDISELQLKALVIRLRKKLYNDLISGFRHVFVAKFPRFDGMSLKRTAYFTALDA